MKRHPWYYWADNPREDPKVGSQDFKRAIEQGPGEVFFRVLQDKENDEKETQKRSEAENKEDDLFDDLELERVGHEAHGGRHSDHDDDTDFDQMELEGTRPGGAPASVGQRAAVPFRVVSAERADES